MVLQAGDLILDTEHRLLHCNGYGGEPIRLTPMESRLLTTLTESIGQVISRSTYPVGASPMKTVWQIDKLCKNFCLMVPKGCSTSSWHYCMISGCASTRFWIGLRRRFPVLGCFC